MTDNTVLNSIPSYLEEVSRMIKSVPILRISQALILAGAPNSKVLSTIAKKRMIIVIANSATRYF